MVVKATSKRKYRRKAMHNIYHIKEAKIKRRNSNPLENDNICDYISSDRMTIDVLQRKG